MHRDWEIHRLGQQPNMRETINDATFYAGLYGETWALGWLAVRGLARPGEDFWKAIARLDPNFQHNDNGCQ